MLTFIDLKRSYGGPVTVAYQLGEAQMRRGDDVRIFALGIKGQGSTLKNQSSVETIIFPAKHLFGISRFSTLISFKAMLWLKRHARNFDVVHFHFSKDLFQVLSAIVVRAIGVNYVIQSHGMLTTTSRHPFIDCLFRPLLNNIIRHSQRQFALNDVESHQLIARDWFRNGHVIGNGIVFPALRPSLDVTRKKVVFLSRLHSRKNPILFVEAAKYFLGQNYGDFDFVLAGPDGGEGETVSRAIADYGSERLTYIGALTHNQANNFLEEATLLVLPSINEPFPMVVLEALSFGVPVVVTNSCHIADLIIENDLGLVSEPNPVALSSAVHSLIERNFQKKEIQLRAKSVFDIDLVASKFNDSYQTGN